MIDLTLKEVCLLRVALTHLAVTGKGKCAVVGDSARVFHDVMGKLTNWRKGSAQDVGLDELRLAKMLLKKNFAKKLSALLCEKTQELLDDFDNDTTFEPTIGEEEHKELLDWADKFIDKIANHAVMVCLEVADGKVADGFEERKDEFLKGFIELTDKTGVSFKTYPGKPGELYFIDARKKGEFKHLVDRDSVKCIWLRKGDLKC